MGTKRTHRSYDHRLVLLVQQTGDPSIATGIGVPRSTVAVPHPGGLHHRYRRAA